MRVRAVDGDEARVGRLERGDRDRVPGEALLERTHLCGGPRIGQAVLPEPVDDRVRAGEQGVHSEPDRLNGGEVSPELAAVVPGCATVARPQAAVASEASPAATRKRCLAHGAGKMTIDPLARRMVFELRVAVPTALHLEGWHGRDERAGRCVPSYREWLQPDAHRIGRGARGAAPAYGDLVRLIAAKFPLVPRYRQKVRFAPGGIGRPVWVDDPHFQILYHIRHTAVPPPGGRDELRNLAGRVFAQTLDRGKPLWELWMVEGLDDGRWAVISKVHHCMVDGISATDLMTVMFDATDGPTLDAQPVEWAPEPDLAPSALPPRVPFARSPIRSGVFASSPEASTSPPVRKPVLRKAQRCCARSRSGADARPHR